MGDIFGFRPFVDPSSKDPTIPFPLDNIDLSKVPDEAILALFSTAPILHRFGGTQIVRLSRSLVLKGGSTAFPAEAHAITLAREKTQIRLPAVHRIIPGKPDDGFFGERCYIVMDYIDGVGLDVSWEGLDADKRADVASQVAAMIGEMGNLTLPLVPWPIGGVRRWMGPWFSDYGRCELRDGGGDGGVV
ncbi:hypothetical protein VE01_06497 [Pseudogymnoascus verrucosus]|uniref:Aminoglycoside phosphotransferase domain-containing protein n=1 Tax=Pseudogymnoascus verrucosus TaxID=342668 RepID=A0A1B8GIT9_9PEZI|nr:uncharacterized protein VE01_06497 [Pseudogymnoascus verrucosus]OBT95716.1 hypothetical protein VE01_06497 [Pseudogymnoascus verrucosus]